MEIAKYLFWPIFGTFNARMQQALPDCVYKDKGLDSEDMEYARLWQYAAVRLFLVKTHGNKLNQG